VRFPTRNSREHLRCGVATPFSHGQFAGASDKQINKRSDLGHSAAIAAVEDSNRARFGDQVRENRHQPAGLEVLTDQQLRLHDTQIVETILQMLFYAGGVNTSNALRAARDVLQQAD
jgi:hypothetical protein